MKPKIAIIGVGRWGKKLLTEFSRQAEVVAVCHQDNKSTTDWLKTNYPDIPVLSLKTILEETSIEAVVIATPPSSHFEIASAALKSGKDVYLEKPGGQSVEQIEALFKLAENQKKILMVGYIFIYHPAWQAITNLLNTQQEQAAFISCTWHKWGSFETPLEENLLCHDLALAYSLFGQTIDCSLTTSIDSISKKDLAVHTLTRDGYNIGLSFINRLASTKNKTVTITGNKGTLLVWTDNQLYKKQGDELTEITISPITALENECREFIEAIVTRKESQTNGHFALIIHQILGRVK